MKKVLIIGAGPAGMMAAITARRNKAKVELIEHGTKVGRKILSTGSGRCNFTNIIQEPIFYRSEDPHFPWQVVKQFSAQDTLRFFSYLGIYSRNRNGYMYPHSDQASAVLEVLRLELERLEIPVRLEAEITSVVKEKEQFYIQTKTAVYQGDRLIIATGGKAAPKTGSDGSGYDYARDFGHTIIPVVPALVQLRCAEKSYRELAGIRVWGKVSLYVAKTWQAKDTGEIQLTDYGISGIPVFQVSRYAAQGIAAGFPVTAELDFMPDFSKAEFYHFLENRIQNNGNKTMGEFFTGVFHKKLTGVLLKRAHIAPDKIATKLRKDEQVALIAEIKSYRTKVTATNSFEQAQVCAGGVNTAELNPDNLESTIVKGLHFAGEIIDVDGLCGGYNLQWAWSSGQVAGKGAALPVKEGTSCCDSDFR